MGTGTERGRSQGRGSLAGSLSGYRTECSALLESRLNTSRSPAAPSSPSEPLRISKLISSRLSVRFSSGMALMTSGPTLARTQTDVLAVSSSQRLGTSFLARRLLPLIPLTLDRPGPLPVPTAASVFKPGPFLIWPRPRVPRLLTSSTGCGSATRSSRSLSSLKLTLRRVCALLCTLGAKGASGLLFVGWTSSNMVKGTRALAGLARPGGFGVQGGPSSSKTLWALLWRGGGAEAACRSPRPEHFCLRVLEGSTTLGLFINGGCQPQVLAKSWVPQQLKLASFARA